MSGKINFFNILILLVLSANSLAQSSRASVKGMVTDYNGQGLADVTVVILDLNWLTVSDSAGCFQFRDVPAGEHSLTLVRIGYQTQILKNLLVAAGRTVELTVRLAEKVISLPEVVVTPGNFAIARSQSVKQQAISKERITALPATLDDIYRVLQVMPGVTFSDDFSAHFHVRGGKQNENLILLDGIEIYDPYHLKNIGGAVGVMNMDLVDNVSIMTGGFEAKYGDRLSSVVAIDNRQGSAERFSGSVTAGGTGLSLLLESPIPSGSGILSYRKSFLKEAAEILNPTDYTFSPSFYDLQGRVSWGRTKDHQLTVNFLYSKDTSYLERWRGDSDLAADYGNLYQGVVWKRSWKAKLFSECIASYGKNFWHNRVADIKEEKLHLQEKVLTWNVTIFPHRQHELASGITFKHITYTYEMRSADVHQDQQVLEEVLQSYFGTQTISPKTYKLAGYLQDKIHLHQRLSVNLGARYDYFDYNENQQVSPRVGIAYHLQQKTVLRAAWGLYYQFPIYAELTNKKGAEYNPSAQKSIHYIIGLEHFISQGLSVRVELYQKTLAQMIGHYFEWDALSGQPELRYGNPNSGSCRGIEFFLNGRITKSLSLWATYAYSRTTIEAFFVNWQKVQIEQQTIPRSTDQPHNLSLFLTCRLPHAWEVNLKWRYLSGIPYTPHYPRFVYQEPYWESGAYYSARYPVYHRLDVRVGKSFTVKYFQLAAFLEIKNLYNRRNVLLYDYQIENGQPIRKAFYTLPFLPTIECKLSF